MSTAAVDYAPAPEPEVCVRQECAQDTLEQDEARKPPQIKEMERLAKESARKQQDDILDRDAHVPLCDFFRGKYGAEKDTLPLRSAVKRDLMRAMAMAYPDFDFVMRMTLVEHYLDNPEDTPDQLLARAPKNYFDEKNAKVTISNPQPPQPPMEHPLPLLEEQEEEEEGFEAEGPPGGRGTLIGDNNGEDADDEFSERAYDTSEERE